MKKILLAVLVLISVQSFGQFRLYAIRQTGLTVDSIYIKYTTDSLFLNGSFISFSVEHFKDDFEPPYPLGFANYKRRADGVWTNFSTGNAAGLHFALDAGSNDSYVITLYPAPTEYAGGMIVLFRANTNNTGAASINVNGLGVKTIVKRVNTTLANSDIISNMICLLIYDGTNFVLLNPVVN